MIQPCDELTLWWKLPVVPTMNRLHQSCDEPTLQWVDPAMNWLSDKSTWDITTLRLIDPQKIDYAMRQLYNESTRHKLTCNELSLRLIDAAIDQPAMKRTQNWSCDESTLRWIGSLVKNFCGSCNEANLWTLRYIEIGINWPCAASTPERLTMRWIDLAMTLQ
jgi:hypothetical protein